MLELDLSSSKIPRITSRLLLLLIELSLTINQDYLGLYGQVIKRTWWMPWQSEAMKDVTACDKLRGGGNILWSGDFWMGKPT